MQSALSVCFYFFRAKRKETKEGLAVIGNSAAGSNEVAAQKAGEYSGLRRANATAECAFPAGMKICG